MLWHLSPLTGLKLLRYQEGNRTPTPFIFIQTDFMLREGMLQSLDDCPLEP